MLETAGFDVLLILDCCYAAGAITKGLGGTMEVLAGCSRESNAGAPGASSAIGSPFTDTLIRHLEESATRPRGLLMTELQTLLSLDKVLENQSPIHVLLTGHHNPIKLRPLLSEAELKEIESPTSQTIKPELKALLAISFRGNVLPEMEEFVQWLNSQYPKEVAKIEVERVSIEGYFDGGSTLMLLSMPISMWAYLDGSHGSTFAGFVKSRNLLVDESKLRMTQLEMKMARMVSMMREEREKAKEEREKAREAREKEEAAREKEEEAREEEKKKGEEAQLEMAKLVSMMREERDKAREKEEAREEEKKKKERRLGQRWRKWVRRSEDEGE